MKIDQLLASSAMLSALFEKRKTDNLELLKPFVVMCLADVATIGELVPKSEVLKVLDEKYGFPTMPVAVLDKVLMRLERDDKSIIEKCPVKTSNGNQFLYKKEPSTQISSFQSRMQQAEHETERVLDALVRWLEKYRAEDATPRAHVKKSLGKFFEENGFDIYFDPDELRSATTKNTDALNYQIGRFILDAKENDSALFEKITNIAQGVMLCNTIYVSTTPETKFTGKHKLRNVEVFLDTTLLLCALNWKTEESKQSADALLALLRNNGASIYVFEQHYMEIADILRNSQTCRSNPTLSLEGLEGKNYSILELDAMVRGLENSLGKLGVKVYRGNKFTDEEGNLLKSRDAYIDYSGLCEHLEKRFRSYKAHSAMLTNDVDAISAVMVKRSGVTYQTIEACPAVFVTTNYKLVREGNNFLHYDVAGPYITPVMSDADIATILWLKYGMQASSSIPRLKLVEYARAAVQPSTSVMDAFNDIATRLVAKGTLTEDEAANMRYDAYAKAEMTRLCNGDGTALTDEHITDIRDRLKEKYNKEERERADEAVASAASAQSSARQAEASANRAKEGAVQQAKQKEKKINATKQEITERIHNLRKSAEEKAEKRAEFWSKLCYAVLIIGVLGIMVASFVVTVFAGIRGSMNALSIAALIVAAMGAFALFAPGIRGAKRAKEAIKRSLYYRFEHEEKEKIKDEIEQCQNFLNTLRDGEHG